MTQVISSLAEWRKLRASLSGDLGFVPTMGNLHQGHLSLLEKARAENESTLLSLFINPTQFNNKNDFEHYPKTLEQDLALAEKAGVDYVLHPQVQDLYPDDYSYQVSETKLSLPREGASRPGHFTGMLTVVLKLLLLAKAKRAYFGEKDYQQLQLVKGLVQAFFLDTEIIPCPTIRNDFGLPLSSRNSRLSPEQLEQVRHFPAIFHSQASCEEITERLSEQGFAVDYVEEYDGRRFAALKIGELRLIDNIEVQGK